MHIAQAKFLNMVRWRLLKYFSDYLKRREVDRRPTERSVFEFFSESWLFYRQDFGFKMEFLRGRKRRGSPRQVREKLCPKIKGTLVPSS